MMRRLVLALVAAGLLQGCASVTCDRMPDRIDTPKAAIGYPNGWVCTFHDTYAVRNGYGTTKVEAYANSGAR
jgi:uncharacterized protein YceK